MLAPPKIEIINIFDQNGNALNPKRYEEENDDNFRFASELDRKTIEEGNNEGTGGHQTPLLAIDADLEV